MSELQDVKVGDMLYIKDHGWGKIRIFKVDRITKLHVLCGDSKFAIKSGKWVGTEGWGTQWAHLATPEILREYKTQRLKEKITSYITSKEFRNLPLESLSIIAESLPIAKIEKAVTP